MAYRTGIISGTNAPAQVLILNTLEPDLINVGFVKVGTNVSVNSANAANNLIWQVYKSPGTNNSIGKDWHISLGWDNASNCNVVASIFEQFNGSTNTCLGYGPAFSVTNVFGTTNTWCNVNVSGLPGTPGGNAAWLSTQASGSSGAMANTALGNVSHTYNQSITIDRVIFQTANIANVNSGPCFYLGTYDSFMSAALDPMPIVAFNFMLGTTASVWGGANSEFGFFTREPALNSGNATSYALSTQPLNNIFNTLNTPEIYSNRIPVTRCMLTGRGSQGFRGLLKDTYQSVLQVSRGDTYSVTINGTTYTAVCTGPFAQPSNQFFAWLAV